MEITAQDKEYILALKNKGWDEHKITVDLFSRKYSIEFDQMRLAIQICLEEHRFKITSKGRMEKKK